MAKTYTAQEMRDMVVGLEQNRKYGMERVVIASPKLIEMLRQAADAIEREEKREKKYEYAEREVGGRVRNYHRDNPKDLYLQMDYYSTIVRREVGEWEEMRDGE